MKTVLLVDDEPELLDFLTYLFKQFNYNIITYSYIISVEDIRNLRPNVIILDNNLEKKTGGELCLEIKNDAEVKDIPVVLFSSNEMLPQIAKDSCADAYLEKPVDVETLLKTVRKVTMEAAWLMVVIRIFLEKENSPQPFLIVAE